MSGFLDDLEIPIVCSKCGHETPHTIGWMKSNRQFKCECGHMVEFGADDFGAGMAEVDRAFEALVGEGEGVVEKMGSLSEFVAMIKPNATSHTSTPAA